ncbi:uncharacterized protein LOC134835328 [Culicoides brevitarsis]|uniref:uncharacterized protein LOC134835328 n=1 Tax=Culicoides brevitarsis TaxID=469753 RepID=UPI00307B65C7
MEKRIKKLVETVDSTSISSWSNFVKTLYAAMSKETDHLKVYLKESLVILVENCGNEQMNIRLETEENISKILHLCNETRSLSFVSFLTLNILKERSLMHRSVKMCIQLLSYSMDSIKPQKQKDFALQVFCIVTQKCEIFIDSVCIESFSEFFNSYIRVFGRFLNGQQVLQILQTFKKYIYFETSLIRHCLCQCIAKCLVCSTNYKGILQKEILKWLVIFQTSTNEKELIGLAEILKYNIYVMENEFLEQLLIELELHFETLLLHKHIGVINMGLELLIALFKSTNNDFKRKLLKHTLYFKENDILLIDHIFKILGSQFLYEDTDGSPKTNVLVSIQSNVIEFFTVCTDFDISQVTKKAFLTKILIEMSKHNDFIIREKTIVFLSKFINTNIEEKRQIIITLALAFKDPAHTVVASLIAQLSESFNDLLLLPINDQIFINNVPFTTFLLDKILSFNPQSHWLVIIKVCEFNGKIDFGRLRVHLGYSMANYYKKSCFVQLLTFLSSKDIRIALKSAESIKNSLRFSDSDTLFHTHIAEFASKRYYFNKNLLYHKEWNNVENFESICNDLVAIEDIRRKRCINVLADCISKISHTLLMEYTFFETILTMMIEDYSTAIDIICHSNLFTILQHILTGLKDEQKHTQNLVIIKCHIINIIQLYLRIFETELTDICFDANASNTSMTVLKNSTPIYERLYDVLKRKYENSRLTLEKKNNEELFQLLQNAMNTLSTCMHLFSISLFVSTEEYAELIMSCNIFYKHVPHTSIMFLVQLINNNNSISYKKNLYNYLNLDSEKQDCDCFHNVQKSLSKIESIVINLQHGQKQHLEKVVEKSLKQFVSKAIMEYDLNAELQCGILELMCILLYRNFDYSFLDPEMLLLTKVLVQFDILEQSMPRIADKTLKSAIRFILTISIKKISTGVTLSKVMNLMDTSLTNTHSCATTIICELLVSIFCNDYFLKIENQAEINTLKEVLLHTLYKFKLNVEIMQTLPLIINNGLGILIEIIRKYFFGQLIQQGIQEAKYYYFALLTIDTINHYFTLPDCWIKLSIEQFMKTDLYDLECLLYNGCWLYVMLTLDFNLLFKNIQLNGYLLQDIGCRITIFFMQFFKNFNTFSFATQDMFEYLKHILLKLKAANFCNYLRIDCKLHQKFSTINSRDIHLKKLLQIFFSCTLHEQEISLGVTQFKFLFSEIMPLNIINFIYKNILSKNCYITIPTKNFIKIGKTSREKNKNHMIKLLLSVSRKNTFLLLSIYLHKPMYRKKNMLSISNLPNMTEWVSLICSKEITAKKSNYILRFERFGKKTPYHFQHPLNTKNHGIIKCECLNSIIAGVYLLEMKSERKVFDVLESQAIDFLYFYEWIPLCFKKMYSDIHDYHHKKNNSKLKYLSIPPLMKILMTKMFKNLKEFNLENFELDCKDTIFFKTIYIVSCFCKHLYLFQLDTIGKIDLCMVEKIINDAFLNMLEAETIVKILFVVLENENLMLDIQEVYTDFLKNILKINFIWYKLEKYITMDSELSNKIFFTLSGDQQLEDIMLMQIEFLKESKQYTKRKNFRQYSNIEILINFLRMSPFKWIYKVENSSCSKDTTHLTMLLEYNCLDFFLRRLNLFGFNNKYAFEELFATLLICFNMNIDEDSQTLAEKFRFKKAILEAMCNLIILCYRQPFIGKTDQVCLHYTRIPTLYVGTIWLKKLHRIYCNSNDERRVRNIFNFPNLERSYKERQYYTFKFGKNQGITCQSVNPHLTEMKFDVDSSILLMIELLLDQMSNGNYMEVLPSLSSIMEFNVTKDRFDHLICHINSIKDVVSIHDTLSYQHIVFCLLKCLSFGDVREIMQSSNIWSVVNTCLKNKQMFLKVSTMHGLLAISHSFFVSETITKDDKHLFCTSLLSCLNNVFSYSEVYDRLLCSLKAILSYHDNSTEIMNRYLETNMKNEARVELICCVLQSFENLIVRQIIEEKTLPKLLDVLLTLSKEDNYVISLTALQTLVTIAYSRSSESLKQTEEANGVVQTDIQSNGLVLEIIHQLLFILRVCPAKDVEVIGVSLYHLVTDLSRPNDILSLIIKEFLDIYNPYPFLIAKVVFGVFKSAIDANLFIFLQDCIISVLPNILSINNNNERVFRLTVLFSSICLDDNNNCL